MDKAKLPLSKITGKPFSMSVAMQKKGIGNSLKLPISLT